MLGGFPYLFCGVFFRAVGWELQCLNVVSFKKGFDVMLFVAMEHHPRVSAALDSVGGGI